MEIIVFLSIVIAAAAVLTSIVLVRRIKKQIAEMTDTLLDVKNGNGNRRILSAANELTAPLAYEINEIVMAYESRLSIVRQTEETNRQLMTSLSHDVRTPLTTLIGYLDAAHKGLVTGKDRDDYIETARRKAHDLKEYIDVLFDWFKLNSDEFVLEIQSVEGAELTRNILIDWIPIFEDKQVDYDIDIPEQPVRVRLDMDSYMRIINNLIQNVIAHSHANKIKIALSKKENVGFMTVGGLVNLAVLLIQGWEPVGFWTLFGVGIEEGLIMWVGALPCILLVILLNRNYIVSVVITFFYTIANYLLTSNDAFLTQPFGLNAGTLLPGPLAFRWTFQFYDQSQTSAELADLLERISPYFLNHVQVFSVMIVEAIVFLALIAFVYRHQEI